MGSLSFIDLASLSSEKFTLLYTDSEGAVKLDHDDSFWGSVTRFVTSLLRQRDYNLCSILPSAKRELNEKSIQLLSCKVAKKIGLKKTELETIQKLSTHYFKPSHTYTSEEVQQLKTFLEGSTKKTRVLKALKQLQKMELTIDHVHQKALQALESLGTESRKEKKLKKAFDKVEDLSGKLQGDGTLQSPMKKKLSLKEMEALEKVSHLAPIFRDFAKMGIVFEKTSRLGMLKRRVNITENTLNRTLNLLNRQNPSDRIHFIFYDLPNFTAKKPKSLNPLVPFMFRYILRTDISHASFSYRNMQNQEMENHILGEMVQSKRSLSSHPYKTFSPNLEKLLFQYPQALESKLKVFYGPDWKEILTKKYHRILTELFKNPTYEDLPTSTINQFISSLGLGCMLSKGPLQKKLRVSEYKGCICAEFILKSLGQAYTKLEKEVQRDFNLRNQRRGVELEPPKLPHFLTEAQIAQAKTPAGLARVLLDGGLVQERKKPKILAEIMDYKDYDIERALSLPLPWKTEPKKNDLPKTATL